MSRSVRRALLVSLASLGVVASAAMAGWGPGATASPQVAEAARGRAEADLSRTPRARGISASGRTAEAAASPHLVTANLTADGADRYEYVLQQSSRSGRRGGQAGTGLDLVVTAPASNQGVNLREVGWFDDESPAVDAQSCVTWSEFTGPIAQAGVALRVRSAPGGPQAITVTNNIFFGARNGWNVHLWSGSRGEVIGQVVLSHSFGPTVFQTPPLPWRLCARTVGRVVQFKAWSMVLQPDEPAWADPGFGASFVVPDEWVYAGRAGWYVGHLVGGDQSDYRQLDAEALEPALGERVAVTSQASAQELVRSVAATLDQVRGN
ncbi:MAG: hypothetical protein IPG97_04225 [Microthrixaceae bacterium]|nr:hypothetical protein [Microthrixaceae bacterium]